MTVIHYDSRQSVVPQIGLDRPEHWTEQAACLNQPLSGEWDPWYPEKDASYADARRICNACPVKSLCLDAAMAEEAEETLKRQGMRGGLTPNERKRLAKGMPVKVEAEPGDACGNRQGTETGYQRHRAAGEKACRPCVDAQTAASNRRKQKAKAARELVRVEPTDEPPPDWLTEARRNALDLARLNTTHIHHPGSAA
jgi:WhiB family redox-sensing transcriptional regulator